MKKTIFAIVALSLIYGGLWYKSANTAKELIEEKLLKATTFLEAQGYTLTNEGVSVKGFPINYEVEIKKPKLERNSNNLNPDNTLESIYLNGDLTLTSNLFGTKFSIKKMGDDHIQLRNSNKEISKIQELLVSGTTLYSFSVNEKSIFESIKNPFKSLFKILEENENEFLVGRKGSFNVADLKVIDIENPSLSIFEVKNAEIDYEIKETNKEISAFKIAGKINGMNLDTFLLGPSAYTPGSERSLKEIALLLSMPKLGKTDISFDLDLNTLFNKFQGLNSKSTLADLPPFNFDLKKFEMSNDFGNYFHKVNFTFLEVKDGIKQFTFNAIATSETSKAQFETLKGQWGEFLSNLPMCNNPNEPCRLIKGLIPELDQFGKITAQADLKFSVPNYVDLLDNSTFLINHLDYFSNLYGLKSNGVFDFKKPDLIVSTYKMELLNYQVLFQDLFNYLQKVQDVLPLINPEASNFPKMKEEHVKMITDYLRQISDEPSKNIENITVTVKINGPQVNVGTLSQDEFIQKTEALKLSLIKSYEDQLNKKNEEEVK